MISEVHTISQSIDARSLPSADYKPVNDKSISFSKRVNAIFSEARERASNLSKKDAKESSEENESLEKYSIFPFQKEVVSNDENSDEEKKKILSQLNNITLTKKEWNIDKKNKSKERIILESILNLKEVVVYNKKEAVKNIEKKSATKTNEEINNENNGTTIKSSKKEEGENIEKKSAEKTDKELNSGHIPPNIKVRKKEEGIDTGKKLDKEAAGKSKIDEMKVASKESKNANELLAKEKVKNANENATTKESRNAKGSLLEHIVNKKDENAVSKESKNANENATTKESRNAEGSLLEHIVNKKDENAVSKESKNANENATTKESRNAKGSLLEHIVNKKDKNADSKESKNANENATTKESRNAKGSLLEYIVNKKDEKADSKESKNANELISEKGLKNGTINNLSNDKKDTNELFTKEKVNAHLQENITEKDFIIDKKKVDGKTNLIASENKQVNATRTKAENIKNGDDVELINKIKENMKKDSDIRINVKNETEFQSNSDRQSTKTKISELIKLLGNENSASDIETISISAKKSQKVKEIEQKQETMKNLQGINNEKSIFDGDIKTGDKSNMKNKDDKMQNQLKSLHNFINGKVDVGSDISGKQVNGKTEFSSQLPNYQTIKLSEFGKTAMNTIRSMPNNTVHSARLVLQPQSLGTVMIEISLAGDIAKMDIKVDSREAAKSIESQLGTLKDKLANEGIKMESVDVKLSNQNKDMKNGNGQENPFARKEEAEIKKDYLNSFGFLKNPPEMDETEKYNSLRSFIEQGSSFGRYLQ